MTYFVVEDVLRGILFNELLEGDLTGIIDCRSHALSLNRLDLFLITIIVVISQIKFIAWCVLHLTHLADLLFFKLLLGHIFKLLFLFIKPSKNFRSHE